MSDSILVLQTDGVATIELHRPDRLNAFDAAMMVRLHSALKDVTSDRSVRAIVLTGSGKAFCAGADLSRLAELQSAGDSDSFRALLHEGKEIFLLMRSCPQPVVAAVNGVAAGGGCSLALAADWRIATPETRFIQAFIRIGLHPDFGAYWSLPELVGRSRALQLMLSGEPLEGPRALEWGVVNELVAAGKLRERAMAVARRLAGAPRLSARFIKRGLTESDLDRAASLIDFEIEAQVECFLSADAREGVRAFLEKRSPAFE